MKRLFGFLLMALSVSALANTSSLESLIALDADTSHETFLDEVLELDARMSVKESKNSFNVNEDNIKNEAKVVIVVNRANKGLAPDAQLMKVYYYGELIRTFKISTGSLGHATPTGYFRPTYTTHMRVYDHYYSGSYGASPMRHAAFFNGGIAVHSTTPSQYVKLGSRASHGCVRMHEDDAKWVNELIRTSGSQNTSLKKWRHQKFAGTKHANKWNSYYSGLEIETNPINRYTGKLDTSKTIKSVDTIVVIKDEIK